MTEVIRVAQAPVLKIDHLEVDPAVLSQEPYMRRADPNFAYEMGGLATKQFLDAANRAGLVHENSLVRIQPTIFVSGAYATPPQWHFDFVPGVAPNDSSEQLMRAIYSNHGALACLFNTETHPEDTGTLFLGGGDVSLDLSKRESGREYTPGHNFSEDGTNGKVYWWDPDVRRQISIDDGPEIIPTLANSLYSYTSANMHHVPIMKSSGGTRLLLRVNTPYDESNSRVAENKIVKPTDKNFPAYVFRVSGDGTWSRERT